MMKKWKHIKCWVEYDKYHRTSKQGSILPALKVVSKAYLLTWGNLYIIEQKKKNTFWQYELFFVENVHVYLH